MEWLSKWSYQNMSPNNIDMRAAHDDLLAVGAASVDTQYLTIKLEGRRNQNIFIDRIKPVDIRRSAPYSGTLINIPPQDGGERCK